MPVRHLPCTVMNVTPVTATTRRGEKQASAASSHGIRPQSSKSRSAQHYIHRLDKASSPNERSSTVEHRRAYRRVGDADRLHSVCVNQRRGQPGNVCEEIGACEALGPVLEQEPFRG